MTYIPVEIWQDILLKIRFLDQIRLRQVCKLLYTYLEIYDFYHINDMYLARLNDSILMNYNFIRHLYASDNPHITDINHMTKLSTLNASYKSGIRDAHINQLNLEKLIANCNKNITNLNHMTNLKTLEIRSDYLRSNVKNHSGVNDIGISKLSNLEQLDVDYNYNITDINHMTNLTRLDARGHCGINNDSIVKFNLKHLDVFWNKKVTDIKHMTNITRLYPTGSGIDENDIRAAGFRQVYNDCYVKMF